MGCLGRGIKYICGSNMENFVVSARKYRPQKFEDVVGQQAITKTLLNAINSHHLAQAFLFCGPRGVGKTTCARILAKTINAQSMGANYNGDDDFSFNIFELDAASNNSVDDIRSLTEQVRFAPQVGSYKVYIIDEVHMLSQAAFNAFLKTLEEPPPYAIFILATTEKHKIIPTILSRCQIFDFKRIEVPDIVEHLKGIAQTENVEIEDAALHIIAQKADGALRDALSIFDQVVSFSGNKISYHNVIENLNVLDYDYYFKITEALHQGNYPDVLLILDEILYKGFDGHHFINGLASHLRDLLMCKHQTTLKLLQVSEDIKEKYFGQAKKIDDTFIFEALKFCNDCDVNYKSAKNQRLLIEYSLIQICGIQSSIAEKKNASLNQTADVPQVISPKKETFDRTKNPNNQVETETPKANNTENLSATAQSILKKPEVKIAQPSGKTDFSKIKTSMGLGTLLKDSGLKTEEIIEEPEAEASNQLAPKENFSSERLKQAWDLFAEKLEQESDVGFFYNSYKNVVYSLKENNIRLLLNSATEEKEWQNRKPELLEFLRNQLKNFNIDLSWEVSESKETLKYYTNSDKFKRMVELNPNLAELKKQLNLELD